jgi:hypothetical protein
MVIGLGKPNAVHAATAAELLAVNDALERERLGHPLVVNGFGEAWGYDAYGQVYTPDAIAALVRAGTIWVDYCGWPGFYQALPEQAGTRTLGPAGFAALMAALGYRIGRLNWDVRPQYQAGVLSGFSGQEHWLRAFPLYAVPAEGLVVQAGPDSVTGWPLLTNGYANLVAFTPRQARGLYVYATHYYLATFGTPTPPAVGVPPGQIATFVAHVLRGGGIDLLRYPWPIVSATPPGRGTAPPEAAAAPWIGAAVGVGAASLVAVGVWAARRGR